MEIPWWLEPLVAKGIARFWHDTAFYIFPPHSNILVEWVPREADKVYHVFKITFGKPRDFDTGEVVYTDEVYFYHSGKEMVWHYDPLVESILNVEYPHHVTVTRENPIYLYFVNDSDRTVQMDISIWIFEYKKEDRQLIEEYLDGVVNFFRQFAGGGR